MIKGDVFSWCVLGQLGTAGLLSAADYCKILAAADNSLSEGLRSAASQFTSLCENQLGDFTLLSPHSRAYSLATWVLGELWAGSTGIFGE